jgi:hypothetical protein
VQGDLAMSINIWNTCILDSAILSTGMCWREILAKYAKIMCEDVHCNIVITKRGKHSDIPQQGTH